MPLCFVFGYSFPTKYPGLFRESAKKLKLQIGKLLIITRICHKAS